MGYLFIASEDSMLMGIYVNNDIMTYYYRGDKHAGAALQGLVNYVHNIPNYKKLGYSLEKTFDPDDELHTIAHPCGDVFSKAQHIHFQYNKPISLQLIQLHVICMSYLERDPQLREKLFDPNEPGFYDNVVNYLLPLPEHLAEKAFVPKDDILLFSPEDKKRLLDTFKLQRESDYFYQAQPNLEGCVIDYQHTLLQSQQNAIDKFQETYEFTESRDHKIALPISIVLALTCCCTYLYKQYGNNKKNDKPDNKSENLKLKANKMQ